MIETKQFEGHTPAPWRAVKEHDLHVIGVYSDEKEYKTNAPVRVCVVAKMSDAKLIAKVPELLKENQSLRSELQRLQYDLDDALDIKNGNGPTALSRLSNELQKQKERNAELVKAMEKMQIQVQRDCSIGSDPKYFDLLCVWQEFESLIKKSKPV